MKLENADIERASQQHLRGIEDDLQDSLMGAYMPHDEMDDIEYYITDAFGAGAKWGARRIIKDLWHDVNEEKIREAADKWMESLNPYYGNDWDKAETAYRSFLVGCYYIIKQLQKNNKNDI